MKRLSGLGLVETRRGRGVRYGKNPHMIRSLFRSRWRLSGCDPEVAEFFMGHDIDKLGYDKSSWISPEWFEQQYLKAEPWLNVLSEEPEKASIYEYNKIERQLLETRRAIKGIEWLLQDPNVIETLKNIVRERRGN